MWHVTITIFCLLGAYEYYKVIDKATEDMIHFQLFCSLDIIVIRIVFVTTLIEVAVLFMFISKMVELVMHINRRRPSYTDWKSVQLPIAIHEIYMQDALSHFVFV